MALGGTVVRSRWKASRSVREAGAASSSPIPLVEEDEPEPRRPGLSQPVPLHPQTPGIEGGGEMRGGALPHPLRHRGDE